MASAIRPYVTTLPGGMRSTSSSTRSVKSTPRSGLVGGLTRIDLIDPRPHTAADVDGGGIAGALQHSQRLGPPCTRLAVEDGRPVGRDLLKGIAVQELALRNEHRARDLVDLVLVGLTDIDEHEVATAVVALLEPPVQRLHRDGG